MNREEFNTLLKKAKISKVDFATIIKIKYLTVNGWGSPHKIPYWVKSWIENYIKSEELKEVKRILKCENNKE